MRVAFLAAVLITGLIFVWQGAARPEDNLDASADARLGRKIYLWTGCANCHGTDARGAWKGPDLTDPRLLSVRTDQNLFDVIKLGRRDTMMAFYGDELADEQIDLIVAFLRDEGRKRSTAEMAGARK